MKVVWKIMQVFACLWALMIGTAGVIILGNVMDALQQTNLELRALHSPESPTPVVRCPDGSIRIGGDPSARDRCVSLSPFQSTFQFR